MAASLHCCFSVPCQSSAAKHLTRASPGRVWVASAATSFQGPLGVDSPQAEVSLDSTQSLQQPQQTGPVYAPYAESPFTSSVTKPIKIRGGANAATFNFCGMPFTFNTAKAYIGARLHSYPQGERVSPGDQQMLLELLRFHPNRAQKEGCGISHFTVDLAPNHDTKCYWLHRTDGTSEDFSYMKSLKAYAYMHLSGQVDAEGNPTQAPPNIRHHDTIYARLPASNATAGQYMQGTEQLDSSAAGPYTSQPHMADVGAWQTSNVGPTFGDVAQSQPGSGAAWGASTSSSSWPSLDAASASSMDDWYADQDFGQMVQEAGGLLQSSQWGRGAAPDRQPAQSQWNRKPQPGKLAPSQPQPQSQAQTYQTAAGRVLTWRECLLALKLAIADQLRSYKAQVFAAAPDGAVFDASGEPLTPEQVVIGYQPPQDFKQLVVAWMQSEGMTHRRELVVGYPEGGTKPVMLDQLQMVSWQIYHQLQAQLQVQRRTNK